MALQLVEDTDGPFLRVLFQPDNEPHPRDLEELIETHRVGIMTLKSLMFSGNMMLPSVVTCSMALSRLEAMGFCS